MDSKPNPSFSLEGPGDNAGERHADYIATAMNTPLAKLKPNRRWLQISLRSVLVVVSLLCVALSLWVVPLERRRRAVEAIEALGGIVIFVNNETRHESFSVAFLRRWLPQAFVDEVEEVDFSKSIQNTDAGLAHLHELTSLKRLALDNPIITDAGLAHLQGLTSLQVLDLENSQVTDAGLAHLHGLTGLKWLWLHNTQVTNMGLTKLRKALPNCNIRVNRSVPFSHLLRSGNILLFRPQFSLTDIRSAEMAGRIV